VNRPRGVVLIGYRGSGKSTVGRIVAQRLGWEFVDVDEWIVREAGRSIADIFADEGEAGFRAREAGSVQRAISQPGRVVSVGGGAVEAAGNRAGLHGYGLAIWLDAPAELLWERICADPHSAGLRPDLAGGGLAEVEMILARRRPLYAETAHLSVSTAGKSPAKVAAEIEGWVRPTRTTGEDG
jgi:shikimate kinase